MADLDLAELRKQCVASLYLCTENAGNFLQQNKESEIKRLEECTKIYCELDAKEKVLNEALENAKREVDTSNLHELQKQYEKHLEKLTKRTSKSTTHPFLLEFNNRLAKLHMSAPANLDESDLAVMESVENFIDPISKKAISEPVRNRQCGHIYDKSVILQILSKNHRLKCPVAGCGNRNVVTHGDLEEDEELTMRITLTQQSNASLIDQHSVLDLDCTM